MVSVSCVSDTVSAALIGAAAGLVGAITGSLLTFYFNRVRERDEFKQRWDRDRLDAFATFHISANGAYRKLLAARHALENQEADTDQPCWLAIEAFEQMHQDSETVTLLAGPRGQPVRRWAREMREALRPLADETRERRAIASQQAVGCASLFREARDNFIIAVQDELEIKHSPGSLAADPEYQAPSAEALATTDVGQR